MRRNSLIESPATVGPVSEILRITTVLTGMTPGQLYKAVNAAGVYVNPVLSLFRWISGKLHGIFGFYVNFSQELNAALDDYLDGTSSHPSGPGMMSELQRIEWLRDNLGLQIFHRVGDDGPTITWEALGRVRAEPSGGLLPYATILDDKENTRKSVASLIDALIDADGDEQLNIYVDPNTGSNPLGRVLAWTNTTALNDFLGAVGSMENVANHETNADPDAGTVWEVDALPVTGPSGDPRNFQ